MHSFVENIHFTYSVSFHSFPLSHIHKHTHASTHTHLQSRSKIAHHNTSLTFQPWPWRMVASDDHPICQTRLHLQPQKHGERQLACLSSDIRKLLGLGGELNVCCSGSTSSSLSPTPLSGCQQHFLHFMICAGTWFHFLRFFSLCLPINASRKEGEKTRFQTEKNVLIYIYK